MQETKNDLKLLGGRVSSLECGYENKGGFDYAFSLEGRNLSVPGLRRPILPINEGDDIAVVCDKKWRVLGLKNRCVKSAVWYDPEPSIFFAALFFALFLLFAAAIVWAVFSGFGGRREIFGTLLLVFGFGSLGLAWFKFHRDALLGVRVRSLLGAQKEAKANGEATGEVRGLRIFEAKDKIYFNAAIADVFLWGSATKKRGLELANGDEASAKYENFRITRLQNLGKNALVSKSQGFFQRGVWFGVDVVVSLCAGFSLIYLGIFLGDRGFSFAPFTSIVGVLIILGGGFNVFYKNDD